MTTSRPSRFVFEIALLALASCAPADDTQVDAGDAGVFVAVASDFKCYGSWNEFDLAAGDGGIAAEAGCAHVADVPRVAFMNKLPPHGSTSFPVGTMIVKEIHTTANPTEWPVFAMVKRGGGFGPGTGCEGWEWYGLNLTTDACDAHMQWSGLQAPTGELYASCGPCAGCHSAAQTNDCVLAPEMSLGQW